MPMTVECLVSVREGEPLPRNPYIFATLPRAGDKVTLDAEGPRDAVFEVHEVHHIAQASDGTPAVTIIFVRKN